MRKFLDSVAPYFNPGGQLQHFQALYEAIDTFLYTPGDVTRGAPHVRDAVDVKRVMVAVVLAVFPPLLIGVWNTGYQANLAMAGLGIESMPGWRGELVGLIGLGYNSESVIDCLVHGLAYFLPIMIVTFAVGITWEIIFAAVRNHDVNEGFFVTSFLYALILPPTTPLWQVALGISFGVVIAKELFGGTGKNFINPALAGRAFLYFAYPIQMSGTNVWVPVDGFSGATALGNAALDGMTGIAEQGLNWTQAFLGIMDGSIGEVSALACLIGGLILIYTGVASWRIIAGVFIGMVTTTMLFNAIGSDTNPMFSMPWYWHLVLGGFAFGMVYMATDPVTACQTDAGRWVFGLLVGFLTIAIRVANPAFPEGIMLAILFANVMAPLIDWFVIRANVRRRIRRNVT
ncbi:MAG: NADH:ubiquinone reductase (Na(+)-transporting) subunit B [Gammaproteobacteria bacterium]|nr:NADH:ubiquinone reductase (Na(+)-transporting) subunit B [Gammaproteobacteria bacterium]